MTTATSTKAPLIFSQDYELFFHDSGSIADCLITPSDLLCAFADKHQAKVTFFVDAGMISRMGALAGQHAPVRAMYDEVRTHVRQLASQGHEVALHVHPHWQDTDWHDSGWHFAGSRYRLDQFTRSEASDIVTQYANVLSELTDAPLASYRAGGFCIEPFEYVRDALQSLGIDVDSSIVPGAVLRDAEKGFDFSRSPRTPWWAFDDSPLTPQDGGRFLEIPVTPMKLPFFHYWRRLFARLARSAPGGGESQGGTSKRLGSKEVVRRLLGAGRVSELSSDGPKAGQLEDTRLAKRNPVLWQVMGHPKLLTPQALTQLSQFIEARGIDRVTTIDEIAKDIRSGALSC